MNRITLAIGLAPLALGLHSAQAQVTPPGATVTIPRCLVSLVHDVQVPAQDAGVIVSLDAREGLVVEADTLLGRINDSDPRAQKRFAEAELTIARTKAENDVDVRFARAAAKVAEYAHQAAAAANTKIANATSAMEMQHLLLAWHKATLQIEQSEHTQAIAQTEIEAKAAQVDAAQEALDRRQIKAPVSGEIVEVYAQVGEWVRPGDPVLRIVRLDRLRIEGFVLASEVSPDEIHGRPIEVICTLARGNVASFQGKIVFIHPRIEASGEYRVWAEVVNRMEHGQWLLRPGHQVQTTIFLQAAPLVSRPEQAVPPR